jgi:hypothetical protein
MSVSTNIETNSEWAKERIYRPKEHVRARKLTNGNWEVYDGVKIIELEEGYFKANYELAAQSQVPNKDRGQHEYTRS